MPLYMLGIFETDGKATPCPNCGHVDNMLAFFAGAGAVERDLSASITAHVAQQGRFWFRRRSLEIAVSSAIHAALMDAKHEAVSKHGR